MAEQILIEVAKGPVMAFLNSMERGRENRLKILTDNGILLDEKEWFEAEIVIKSYHQVLNLYGEMNTFLMGKAIIENAEFPPIENLKEGLESINIAYHMNHRLNGNVMFNPQTGKITEGIGHYNLTEFNESNKTAVMVCDNPYPSKFDEGIITQIVRKFKPTGSTAEIKLDLTKETRKDGAKSCTYLIKW